MATDWQELIDQLRGSADTPEEVHDLIADSAEFAEMLDNQVFQCVDCSWWCDLDEEASDEFGRDELTCRDCCS